MQYVCIKCRPQDRSRRGPLQVFGLSSFVPSFACSAGACRTACSIAMHADLVCLSYANLIDGDRGVRHLWLFSPQPQCKGARATVRWASSVFLSLTGLGVGCRLACDICLRRAVGTIAIRR
jgi:hypothetical protein